MVWIKIFFIKIFTQETHREKMFQSSVKLSGTFGTAVLLETLYVVSHGVFIVDGVFSLTNSPEHKKLSWLRFLLVLLTVKGLLFFGLVWAGFVWKGKPKCLRIWLFLEFLLDCLCLVVVLTSSGSVFASKNFDPVSQSPSVEQGSWTSVHVFWPLTLATIVLGVILFRGLMYHVMWTEVSTNSRPKIVDVGLILEKNDSRKIKIDVAATLLIVQALWNFCSLTIVDLPMELAVQRFIFHDINDPEILSPLRPAMSLRVGRLLVSAIALCFLQSEKLSCLKYAWLPLQLIFMEVAGLTPMSLVVTSHMTSVNLMTLLPCFVETVTCLIMDLVLVYNIVKIIVERPNIIIKSIMPSDILTI